MAESDYKVSLGIELNEKQLNAVKTTINNLVDKERKIDINIDFNILNANKLSDVGREIEDIKKQVKELNNSGANGKNKPLLSVDSKSIEASLKKINESINKLQNAFGKVDSKKGVQSLLTTVNKIRAALDGVSKQFTDLNKNLTALSNKNFDFKFDFGLNDKNNPERIMNEFKMLKKEAEAYENYFNKEFSSRIKSDRQSGGIFALASEFDKSKQTKLASLLSIINSGDGTGSAKTNAALREYINLIKEIMALSNGRYKSDIVESRLAGDESFVKMKNELSETEKQLKEIFSGGINAEQLHADISGIVAELGKIQSILDTLSKGFAIEDITKSFQEMSSVLKQLTDNAELLKDALGAVVSSASGNIPNAANNVKQAEKIISESAKNAIDKVSSKEIEVPFTVSKIDSSAFENEMNNLVRKWTNGKGNLVDVKIDTKTSFNEETGERVEKLAKAHVTYQNAVGESIKKTIEWGIIGTKVNDDGSTETIEGFVEASAKYSKSIDKTKTQTDNFAKQQKKAVSDLTNTINQLNSAATDQNAARPIKDQKHLNSLEAKYKDITDAITRMGNASRDTFDDERNNVNKLISEYKVMKSEFKNAENVANKLSGTDYKSGRNIAEQNLAEFKTKAKDYADMSATLDKLDKSFANVGDASSLKEFNNELRVAKAELAKVKAEANAANLGKQLKDKTSGLIEEVTNLRKANSEIENFKAKIDGVEVSIEDLLNDLGKVKTQADFDNVANKFDKFHNAALNAGKILNDFVVKVSNISEIKNKLSDTGFDGFTREASRARIEVAKISEELEKTGSSSEQLRLALQNVDNALEDIKAADNAGDMMALTSANKEYEEFMKRLYSLINLYKQSQKEAFDSDIFGLDKANELLRLESLFEQGSQAAKLYGDRVEELRKEIDSCADNKGLTKIKKEISALEKEVKKSGLHTKTFGSTIKESFSKYFSYFSVSSVFMYAEQALRSMFEQVKLIDSAMTELKKVTDETDESYNTFLRNAASKAKELGTTIDGLVASTADFARLGYGFEDSQKLAEVANVYAVVGDEIEGVEDATQSLVSTLAAFKSEMNGMSDSDFAMGIVDKMNEVSNNFAISSGGIGQALQRSASSMAAANNSLDETIALITAANTVAQNPEKVGNAFKTMSMRIRGAKTELEEAGESTDGMAESTASLRAEMLALSGVDIMLNENTFKSTYQIMDELSEKWQDLSDIAQATIIELVAGKHQGNVFSSLMANFDIAKEALNTSLNSSGSAMREHAKWSESLEARLNKLKAAWQGLSQAFLNSDFLGILIDLVADFVEGLTKLIDTIGIIPTIIGAIGIGKFATGLLTLGKDIKSVSDIFSSFGAIFPSISNVISIFTGSLKGATTATGVLKGALSGLFSVIAAHPILAAVAAIGIGISIYAKHTESAKELAERIEEVTSKYREQSEEIKKLKSSYDTSNEDSLISKYGKLSKGVDEFGENVSLTTDEYSEYQSIVDTIANQIPSLVTGYNSQGDAILGCAGNVDKLTEAYKNLIREQNNEVLKNGEDIFKDFKNDIEKSSAYNDIDKKYDISHIKQLQEFLNSEDLSFDISKLSANEAIRISELLEEYGVERDYLFSGEKGYETWQEHIERAISENKSEIKKILDEASNDINAYAEDLDTVTEAYFSDAFLGDYSDMSDRMQNVINQITSGFDSDFYAQFLDDENPYESLTSYLDSILSAFDNLNGMDAETFETAFDLKTKFNGGDITYGEYVNGLKNAEDIINRLGLDDEVESQIKLSLGLSLDEEEKEWVVKDYETLLNRLTSEDYNIQMKPEAAKKFLDGLNASELAVAVDLVANEEIDFSKFNADSLRKYIEEQAKIREALNFEANVDVDTTALEKLNEILAESASALGLSEESIDSLTSKYKDLDSFNPDKLFESTTNGIKVNRDELVKLEKEYDNLTKSKVKKHLETLVGEYNDVTKEIDKCTNAAERAELMAKRDAYADKIRELAEYEAQLEGVTGAYQRWIDAQNTPESYEGYQAVATSREDIKDEIKRGFLSNATKEYIDLLSGEDLVGGTIDEYIEAWDRLDKKVGSTSYSIHDFFTVNDDGEITSTGIDRFFDGIQKDFKGSVYKLNEETGEWYYDFSQENLQNIQEQWGIGIDAIGLLLEAAASAGYNVDWDGILSNLELDTSDFESLISFAEKAQTELNKLEGYEDLSFNFATTNVKDATTEIEKARDAYLDLITNEHGTINLEAKGADNMRVILSTLLVQKQQLEDSNIVLNIDTSKLDESQQDVANAIDAVKEFREKYKNLEIAVSTGQGIDEAKAALSDSLVELQSLGDKGVDIAAQLILGEGTDGETFQNKIDTLINSVEADDIKVGCKLNETAIGDLNSQLLTNFTPEATVSITKIDDTLVGEYTSTEKTADGTVKWKNDDSLVVEFQNAEHNAEGIVNWANNTKDVQKYFSANGTVKWTSGNKVKVDVISEANGTANANGTTGRAFARGNWGIKGSGTALVGELGMETLVRDGRFYTIGDNGAEFIKYRQGDIIFNHKQTEELFKNGKVTSDNGRGKMFANGSAFVDGSYPSSGRAFVGATASSSGFAGKRLSKREKINLVEKDKDGSTKIIIEKDTYTSANQAAYDKYKNGTGATVTGNGLEKDLSSGSGSGSNTDKFEESFDWIEVAINRVERAIDQLDRKANNVYASWSDRNEALVDEIGKINDEIALQERARQGYLAEANKIGLSSSWISKIQSGAIDIDTITNEDTAKKVQEYQNWYEKALACEDAIEELKITESDLYKQKFDNIVTRYEGILDDIEHEKDLIEEYISQHESRNLSDFVAHDIKDYEVIAEYYQDLITQEQKNLIQLQKEKAELVAEFNSGNIKEGTEAWNEMQAKIHDVDLAIQQANTSIIELNNDIAQSYKDAFDDIASQFDHMLSVIEFKKNMIEEGISHSEAQGWLVSGEYYEALIDMEQDNIDKLQEKKADLLAQLERGVTAEGKSIPMYSEAWWEMCEEIDATTLAIEQSNNALLEYEQTLQQLSWETFDLLEEKISAVTEEADFLVELLSNKKLFDDNGQLTDEGMATMGLHGQNYNTHMYQADLAAEEAEKLKKELESDPFDMELEERYREIVALQQEHILAAEAEKDAIKDMVEEGINLELEALQEKIDLYNEALDSQKDLYDYQRKVKEQTEEIASLEKQMAAYAGDNSEEAQAKIQELKVSLEDAKADLEETEYDKYISDQKQMLDALYLEYETILNERLDNIDALVIGVIEQINANAIGINTTLQEAATSVGYTLSTEMQNIWGLAAAQMQNDAAERVRETTRIVDELVANGKLSHEDANNIIAALGSGEASGVKNATDIINRLVEEGRLSSQDAHLINTTMTTTGNEYKGVVTTYGNNFTSAQTTTNSALRTINTNLQSMISQLNSIASTKVSSAKVSSSTTSAQATAGSVNSKPKVETPKVETPKVETPKVETPKVETPKKDSGDGVAAIGDKVKFVSGKYYYDPQGKAPLGSKNLGKEVYITNINKHSWATHPIHISTGSKLGSGDLGWLKKSQISGYAIGKEKFFDDEIAWTQEGNKQEFIVRPSDGAILTPIAKGDSVLNAVASRNIWDMANNPAEFIRDNLSFGSNSIPNNSNVQSNYTQNLDKVVFNLPNVHSYEELLSAMQKDKNFERLITSMTIDRLAGKSSLAKGKAIR